MTNDAAERLRQWAADSVPERTSAKIGQMLDAALAAEAVAPYHTALAALVAAVRLLDSMVRSGEAHSDQSELVVKKALAAARRLIEEEGS